MVMCGIGFWFCPLEQLDRLLALDIYIGLDSSLKFLHLSACYKCATRRGHGFLCESLVVPSSD